MKRLFQTVVYALALMAGAAPLTASEVVDRIAATVNGRAILASEWDEAIHYQCFFNQQSLQSVTASEKQAALRRLIDQSLIEQQMRLTNFHSASAEEISGKVQAVRAQWLSGRNHAAGEDSDWNAAVFQYGLTQQEISDWTVRQLDELRFIDLRFRPGIHIDSKRVERYYQETLLPQSRSAGAVPPPWEQVAPQIRELLTQQMINEMLAAWLRNLREQSAIEVRSTIEVR